MNTKDLEQKGEGKKRKQPGRRLRRKMAEDLWTGVGAREPGALAV